MKHQVQPNRWSCLPTAFAMVVDKPVQSIFDYLGHDGSEKFWPDMPDPECRRAFHIQELIRYSLHIGYAVVPIDLQPQATLDISSYFDSLSEHLLNCNIAAATAALHEIQRRIKTYDIALDPSLLIKNRGVLVGMTRNHSPHAVAWEGKTIYDPNGATYAIDLFDIHEFYIIRKCH